MFLCGIFFLFWEVVLDWWRWIWQGDLLFFLFFFWIFFSADENDNLNSFGRQVMVEFDCGGVCIKRRYCQGWVPIVVTFFHLFFSFLTWTESLKLNVFKAWLFVILIQFIGKIKDVTTLAKIIGIHLELLMSHKPLVSLPVFEFIQQIMFDLFL